MTEGVALLPQGKEADAVRRARRSPAPAATSIDLGHAKPIAR